MPRLFVGELELLEDKDSIKDREELDVDLNKKYPFEDNHFDEVRIECVLQRVEDPIDVMEEIWRVTKPGSKISIIVPWFKSSSATTDPRNLHLFSFVTFDFLLNKLNKNGKKFELIKIETIPHDRCKWIGNSKKFRMWKNPIIGWRDAFSHVFGEINNYIFVELEVIK